MVVRTTERKEAFVVAKVPDAKDLAKKATRVLLYTYKPNSREYNIEFQFPDKKQAEALLKALKISYIEIANDDDLPY